MDAGVAVIDEKLIRQRIGDDPELLQELIAIFCDTSPALLQKIRVAVTETNGPALRDAAHALKGSVSNFAATRAYEASGRLEVMGETQVFTDAGSACDLLEQEMAALNSALLSRVPPREART
jgi:HPt (histidine-containing phosphotransfer) domain-containing protein